MNEQYVSRLALLAVAMWATVGVMIAAAWTVVMLTDPSAGLLGAMLAASGIALSVCAAVLSIRRMACRVCALIRHTSGLDGGSDGLRSVR